MGLGAIVVMGEAQDGERSCVFPGTASVLSQPLACFDVLGRSTAERIIERFVRADVDVVTVLQTATHPDTNAVFSAFKNVEFRVTKDASEGVRRKLQDYSRNGIEHSFLILGNVYAETDLLDFFYFHREARQAATRAIDRDGVLDFWVLDCLKAQTREIDLRHLREPKSSCSSYFIREYVNRLTDPRDLRGFATDLLKGRCAARPPGREVTRGVWIDDGAEVRRRARLVAPAYIGRGSRIMEDTLVTRFSNVEKGCCVNYGTVVEDSSILQNTDIGICLDVCHAVANGNKLLKLDRNVVIEITDPSVMRSNHETRKPVRERKWARSILPFRRKQEQHPAVDLRPVAPAPKQRRLQADFLQG